MICFYSPVLAILAANAVLTGELVSLHPVVYAGAPDGFGTGKETAARKGISMEFTYKTANVYVYTGTVPLTEAVGP